MKLILILLLIFTLTGCCSFPVTKSQQRVCLRDDLARNWGAEFPKISHVQVGDIEINNPDLELLVSDEIILSALKQALEKERIPLGKGQEKKLKGDYLEISKVKGFKFTDKGYISIDIAAKAHLKKLYSKITFVVDEISVVLLPSSYISDEGVNFLAVYGAIDYLNISSVPANIDRALANLATYELTKKYSGGQIMLMDLTDILSQEIKHPDTKNILNPKIRSTSIVISDGKLVLQLSSK